MKKAFAYSLIAVIILSGCQTKEQEFVTREAKVFTATIEDTDTRTSLDEYGNVLWKQGDQVSIFAGSTVNEQYQVTDASDGKTSAALNKVTGSGFVAGGEIDNNVAYYPYASTTSIAKNGTDYVISDVVLPATQSYAEASFGNGAFPMAAVTSSTTDQNLKFKNVLGGLKLQLTGTATIASISINGNNDEVLCGAAEVTVANGSIPSINLNDASAKTVTLNCGAGVQLNEETATAFVIALPPMTMEGGFTVIVTDTDGATMEIKTTKPQTINRSNLLKMPAVVYEGTAPEPGYLNEPLTLTSHGNTVVAIVHHRSPKAVSLEYKKGDGDWTAYTIIDYDDFYENNQIVGDVIELADGETLQFRAGEGGNDTFSQIGSSASTMQRYYNIITAGTGTVDVSGNIMSLVDNSLQRTTIEPYMFHGLFYGCTNLVDASNLQLPAMTLAQYCYMEMFGACVSLTAAPALPATTLAGYCYYGMFDSCFGLTTAPDLPATELASNCYEGMFGDCRNLTTAPELPAIKLAYECYKRMFIYCESLSTAPELPAANLTYQCYTEMFKRCSSLNYVKASFVTDPNSKPSRDLFQWLEGVSSTGTFVKNAAAKWDVRGSSGIPEGWNIVYDDTDLGLPSIGDPVIQQVDYTSATIMSTVGSDGGHAITSCGFYYGTSEDAINTRSRVTDYVSGDFSKEITGLACGTTYYIKAYATNEVGTVESDIVSFTTMATSGTINGYEWVDIGIRKSMLDSSIDPGSSSDRRIVFAKQNIGANSQSGTGYFFRGNELYGWKYSGSTTSSYVVTITSTNLAQVDNEGNTLHTYSINSGSDIFEWWDADEGVDEYQILYTKGDAVNYYYGTGWSYMPETLMSKLYCHSSWYSSLPSTVNATCTSFTGLTLSFEFSSSGVRINNSDLGTSVFLPLAGFISGQSNSCYYSSGTGSYWGKSNINVGYAGGSKRVWRIYKDRMGSNWDDESEDYTTWEYAWETNGAYSQDTYTGCPIRAVAELPL